MKLDNLRIMDKVTVDVAATVLWSNLPGMSDWDTGSSDTTWVWLGRS